MLKALLPYIKLYKHYFAAIFLGLFLVLLTLSASIFLLSLSGWFLSATAFVGVTGLYTFNYLIPAGSVRAAAIIRTVARYFERLINHNTTFKILSYLRVNSFKKIILLSSNQLQQYQKAELLNRFIADIDHLDHIYLRLFSPILSGLLITICIYFSVDYFNHTVALIIAITLLTSIIVIPIIFYQAGKQIGNNIAINKSQYREKLISYLQGQAELTLFHAQNKYRQELDQLENEWIKNQHRQANLSAIATALILLIIGIMTLMIITFASTHIADSQQPILALYIFIGLSCTEILTPIPNAFLFLGQVIHSANRINHLNNQKPEIIYPEQGKPINTNSGKIEFNHVSFSYPNQHLNVLDQVNFTLNQGEHVALIGRTGCGKSTLLNLITRMWQPNSGKITINDTDITELDESMLFQLISVVPQVITLFNDSLRNNLLIAKPDATDEQLSSILKKVELDKLLETKEGLNLWIGEAGRQLSGGEKRRIGIARALLHNAPITLMDEPTESLDNQTEQQILTIIEQCYHNKTVLMITHRLTENRLFDRTLLLDNGQLFQ